MPALAVCVIKICNNSSHLLLPLSSDRRRPSAAPQSPECIFEFEGVVPPPVLAASRLSSRLLRSAPDEVCRQAGFCARFRQKACWRAGLPPGLAAVQGAWLIA